MNASKQGKKLGIWVADTAGDRGRSAFFALSSVLLLALISVFPAFGQVRNEGRPVAAVRVAFDGGTANDITGEQYRRIVSEVVGDTYSTSKVRDAISRLYDTKQISSVVVDATDTSAGLDLRFTVKRKAQAKKISIDIPETDDRSIRESQLLLKLNLIEPGNAISEQTLKNNADTILEYMRERGYFRAEVTYSQVPLSDGSGAAVTFKVIPNQQATVQKFDVNIPDFTSPRFAKDLKLTPGKTYTREALTTDVAKIREILRNEDLLAPFIDEPRVVYDAENNTISITVAGVKGPTVEVKVDAEKDKPGKTTQTTLLPVKREGTLDYAAIIEGERRLENHYQELGYFFADVTALCSVEPPLNDGEATAIKNESQFLCGALSSAELTNKSVLVDYKVDLNRQLKLVDIRLTGTDQFTIDEIKSVLESQEANILGIIPLFGYGRGYTSAKLLEEDSATIRSLLRELGYRDATVRVNQGVSPDGSDLIITFVVEQGPATIVSDVAISGNNAFSDAVLMAQLPPLVGLNYSRAKARNGQRKLAEFYSNAGYYDAVVDYSIDERATDPATGQKLFKIVYNVNTEGKPVFVNRILVAGNEKTKTQAILKALTIKPGELLRSGDVYTSEQNLYASDAFERVDIKLEPAGDRPDGSRSTDLIVSVVEQAPRILSYGGGYSTDFGVNGFADIRHLNLLGNLWQGGARIRWSQRQQLIQLDYVNPRFLKDGEKRFAPLTISAQYQRDSTVTRFFRSAFDTGTFGIVQRVDENGNPIDQFGDPAGSPTINRLTVSAETNRTLSVKNRSILFVRYRFEDVRLFNIKSLLIKDLLQPDSRTRISGFGATLVRDTRENCLKKYTILEIIARGEAGEPCRYSASDPTRGSFFTAEYNVSLPVLGANIGFNKFQASYNIYHTVGFLKNTTFAGRAILGLGHVFSSGNRFDDSQFPDLQGILPISERFFAGGANTLRGFDFETAGPRVVVVPQGIFRNSKREPVYLDPFTIPFGGNALAVVNLEARIPINKLVRAVPFYDGGNVFRRIGDIFNPPDVPPNDVFRQNLRALWTHTVGLGLRLKTPVGGEFGVDYGYLLNPPRFLIPQVNAPNATYQLPQSQIHFRFSQAF